MEDVATPTVVATWDFGFPGARRAWEVVREGGSALDALEAGIRVVEDDPEVNSVGYGGRPNSEGVVECDAGLLWGPTRRVGAVAGLRDIREAISVARRVLERTRHALLVGEGALEFALSQGFERTPMLTEASRQQWEEWRESQSRGCEGHDTIGMVVVDRRGDVCAGTSTSGIAWKLPGRVGDSPLVGSGFYADNAVGGAAATGEGEEILRYCMSYEVVRRMAEGEHPQRACEAVVKWVVSENPEFSGKLVASVLACDRRGRTGGASTGPGFSYAAAQPDRLEMVKAPHAPDFASSG